MPSLLPPGATGTIRRVATDVDVTVAADGGGLVGPNLRASGVKWDLRWHDGYSAYPAILSKLGIDVPVGQGKAGAVGDSWDRFWQRVEECRQSVLMIREALVQIEAHPEDDIVGKLPKKLKPEGEAYVRVESARGDLGCYVMGAGKEEPYRVKFRTGSFNAMAIIEAKAPGLFLADLVALIASLDVVAPEVDR